jgi:hypothetical protein
VIVELVELTEGVCHDKTHADDERDFVGEKGA